MFGYIYKTTNLLDGKIYVGKKHSSVFVTDYYGSSVRIHEILKAYGKSVLSVEVIDWAVDLDHLNLLERYWIKKLDSRNPEVGYNISAGGNSFCCTHHSEATKKKISESMKNLLKNGDFRRKGDLHKSQETREKLRKINMGHPVSQETRRKIGDKARGRHVSQEVKDKLRARYLGVPRTEEVKEKMRHAWVLRKQRELQNQ